MRILLADDHAVVRRAVKFMLAAAFKEAAFGEAEDGLQALEAALSHPWDLVILDIAMPGLGGLEVLRELRAQRPELPVLMFSMHAERQYVVRAFRVGANGYLTKSSAAAELIKAVGHLLAGGRYVSSALEDPSASESARAGGT